MMKLILKMLRQSMAVCLMVIFAQTYAQVGINTTSPDPSAALDITSDTKGLLIPRITTAARIAMPPPPNSLLVYDLDMKLYFYSLDSKWYPLNPIKTTLTPNGGGTDTVSYVHGKVGIGITNPSERLQVIGNIKTSGSVVAGGSVTAAKVYGEGTVPAGTIVMWSGDPNALPQGWALCDGTAGRPDLRGRFIVGYDNATTPDADYDQVGEVGPRFTDAVGPSLGTNTTDAKLIKLTGRQSGVQAHTHNIIDPGHSHGYILYNKETTSVTDNNNENAVLDDYQVDMPRSTTSQVTGIIVENALERNAIDEVENRPPFYVLAYIIKLPY